MTPTTPSPISDQAAGEPVAWPKITDEMARAFYSAYNIAHEHRGAFESVLAGYNAMQHVFTATTPESAPVAYTTQADLDKMMKYNTGVIYRSPLEGDIPVYLAAPAASSASTLTDVDVEILKAVSAEYNAWIFCHAAGGDFDSFLAERKSSNERDRA